MSNEELKKEVNDLKGEIDGLMAENQHLKVSRLKVDSL